MPDNLLNQSADTGRAICTITFVKNWFGSGMMLCVRVVVYFGLLSHRWQPSTSSLQVPCKHTCECAVSGFLRVWGENGRLQSHWRLQNATIHLSFLSAVGSRLSHSLFLSSLVALSAISLPRTLIHHSNSRMICWSFLWWQQCSHCSTGLPAPSSPQKMWFIPFKRALNDLSTPCKQVSVQVMLMRRANAWLPF